MKTRGLLLGLCLGLCAATPPPPFQMHLDARAEGPRHTLRLRLERAQPNAAPITLRLELPDGATLIEGAAEETVVDATAVVLERSFVIHAPRTPATDARLLAEAATDAWGARGERWYRFGRTDPALGRARGAPVGRPGASVRPTRGTAR